jgi:hypothetical protein
MLSDYTELLSILNVHRVKYLVIGAYAVAIHAQPRATKDLDIMVKADPENAKAVFAALAEFGAPGWGGPVHQSRGEVAWQRRRPFPRIRRHAKRVETSLDAADTSVRATANLSVTMGITGRIAVCYIPIGSTHAESRAARWWSRLAISLSARWSSRAM